MMDLEEVLWLSGVVLFVGIVIGALAIWNSISLEERECISNVHFLRWPEEEKADCMKWGEWEREPTLVGWVEYRKCICMSEEPCAAPPKWAERELKSCDVLCAETDEKTAHDSWTDGWNYKGIDCNCELVAAQPTQEEDLNWQYVENPELERQCKALCAKTNEKTAYDSWTDGLNYKRIDCNCEPYHTTGGKK